LVEATLDAISAFRHYWDALEADRLGRGALVFASKREPAETVEIVRLSTERRNAARMSS
jgi:hypothetical protein